MELVKQLVPILVTVSLALMIVGAAMGSSQGQFAYVLRRPRMLVRAIVAVDVIPVLGAMLVVALFPGISMPAKAAILLMAISPVPPLVPGKSIKFGSSPEYVYGLQLAMAVVAVISVPILGILTTDFYNADARFPISLVAGNIAVGLILPLAVGLVFRTFFRDFSLRAMHWVLLVANVLVVLAFLPIIAGSWRQIAGLIGDGTVIAMAIVILIAIVGGHLLGEGKDRPALVFASAMRHPGIALALIGANHADREVSAGVLLFLLVGLIVLIPYQTLLHRKVGAAASGADHAAKADV